MNLKTFGVAATVAILTISFASMVIVLAPHAFAGGDKCISVKGQPFNVCSEDKKNSAFSGEFKKECREELDKCSSSQTGYGNHKNPKP